jgi:hypothetical protein
MPQPFHQNDDWDEENGWGDDASEEEPTDPCPYCQRLIPEDAPRCPYCEQYISQEDAPPGRKPWWIILGALACLAVVYFWIVR